MKKVINSCPTPLHFLIKCLYLGSVSFGGVAMIPTLRTEFVKKYSCVSDNSFLRGITLTEFLPGSIISNLVGFIAYRTFGFWYGILSSLAIVFPSILMMVFFAFLYIHGNVTVINLVFRGLKPFVVAFFFIAFLQFYKKYVKSGRQLIFLIISFVTFLNDVEIIYVFLLSFLFGSFLLKIDIPQIKSYTTENLSLKEIIYVLLILTTMLLVVFFLFPNFFDFCISLSKISLLAFGGAQSALPLYHATFVVNNNLLTQNAYLDAVLISQITPGPVLCLSGYLGYVYGGFVGAMLAFLFTFVPPIILLILIDPFYDRLSKKTWFYRGMIGVITSLTALLLSLGVQFFPQTIIDPFTFSVMIISAISLYYKKPVIFTVLFISICSYFYYGFLIHF
ncbi:chromate transporter [Thermodesulfobium acidiphilum]|uniref:Chromate transporter n=1 Tax=Thermodesulfobium acidiphilum TaxID=1794699 RepID=A0A2R4W053_THEAF|nr:chromate efflux transporter [Thermodesulfobium acidiphilum]AWB10048.1 chromate transporter [Thermodesulfobium acidiphilum]